MASDQIPVAVPDHGQVGALPQAEDGQGLLKFVEGHGGPFWRTEYSRPFPDNPPAF
jgi:hypothetical protein